MMRQSKAERERAERFFDAFTAEVKRVMKPRIEEAYERIMNEPCPCCGRPAGEHMFPVKQPD